MYLIIDMRTGMMDGMYTYEEHAVDAAERLQQRYQGSWFQVFEMVKDGRRFPGVFPPDHLLHVEMRKRFYKDREYVQ